MKHLDESCKQAINLKGMLFLMGNFITSLKNYMNRSNKAVKKIANKLRPNSQANFLILCVGSSCVLVSNLHTAFCKKFAGEYAY